MAEKWHNSKLTDDDPFPDNDEVTSLNGAVLQ